jgi:outer membrane receptor for ferrienterochelin and colicin
MTSRFQNLGRCAIVLIAGGTLLSAQGSQTSSIAGLVLQGKGVPIPGASVRLTSPSMQGQRTYATDAKGQFFARLLPPGEYTIEVTKEGFETVRLKEAVGLGQTYSPKITLGVVAAATVTVTASSPAVDRSETSSASNFQMEHVDALPMGRTVEAMLAMTPGVADNANNTVNGAQVRGSMSTNNRFSLDGQQIEDSVYGSRGVSVINDALEEVQIITGAIPAEYGDVDGAVVNAITKSGGNEFHGVLRTTLSDAGWAALKPQQDKASIIQKLNHTDALSVGGYLIKDKLWFFVSGQQSKTSNPGAISSASILSPAPTYNSTDDDKRLQLKLTYAVNADHSLTYSYGTHYENQTNLNYIAGEVNALVPQLNQDSFYSFTWNAIWSSNFLMQVRLGGKKERLTGGGRTGDVDPILDLNSFLVYGNGIFNANDGGDNRNNTSADLKLTYIWEGLGNHQMDLGGNFINGENRAKNDQGPNSRIVYAFNVDPVAQVADPYLLEVYSPSSAKANTKSLGFYLNDRWTVNDRVTLNLGLRHDHYSATNSQNSLSSSSSAWSPRLGVKWDLFGDSSWQVGAAYSRYNAKPLATILQAVTNVGNPSFVDYSYSGPGTTAVPWSQVDNVANYTTPVNYSNPSLNVRFADNLHAPHTEEVQLSLSHSFKDRWGDGFVKLTAVQRDYKDLLDYRVGNDGTVLPPAPYDALIGPVYIKIWENNPLAKRQYKGLELEFSHRMTSFDFAGNVTWSSLKGNYQGEGAFTPASGQGINNFTVQDGVVMYDRNITNPYGYLIGHQPLRYRLQGDYHFDWFLGRTTVGMIFRFDSGAHDSITRSADIALFNPGLSPQASNTGQFTQYKDNTRGQVVYQSEAYTDLALTQDFNLFTVAGTSIRSFIKITVTNVWNRQQQLSYKNVWNSPAGVGSNPPSLSDPWVGDTGTGTPTSSANYGAARDIANIQAGFKF